MAEKAVTRPIWVDERREHTPMVAERPGDPAACTSEVTDRGLGDTGSWTQYQDRQRGRRNGIGPVRGYELDRPLILLDPRVLA